MSHHLHRGCWPAKYFHGGGKGIILRQHLKAKEDRKMKDLWNVVTASIYLTVYNLWEVVASAFPLRFLWSLKTVVDRSPAPANPSSRFPPPCSGVH